MPHSSHRRIGHLIGLVALSGLLLLAVGLKRDSGNMPPVTSLRVALGRQLFNDPQLSADGATSCSSCHMPAHAYTDGRPVAIGVFGRGGTRNTPSLEAIGLARDDSFFWDGRRATLNQAVLDPLTNPVEMGLPNRMELLSRIEQNAGYRVAFAHAFPESQGIAIDDIAEALTDFVRSLTPRPSAYDRYLMRGDLLALSPRAQLGLALFKGKGRCAECHLLKGSPAMLTDQAYHRTGVGLDSINQNLPALTEAVVKRSLQGGAVGERVALHADEAQLGRFNVTQDPADIGQFRTPSLRRVASTAPYMHDGSVPTLEEAIDREVYYRGLQAGHPLNLSVEERMAIKVFLETL